MNVVTRTFLLLGMLLISWVFSTNAAAAVKADAKVKTNVVVLWNRLALQAIVKLKLEAPLAARVLASLHACIEAALNDLSIKLLATVNLNGACNPLEIAVAAAARAALVAQLGPNVSVELDAAITALIQACGCSNDIVAQLILFAEKAALSIQLTALTDGALHFASCLSLNVTAGVGLWLPTPPDFCLPLLPSFGELPLLGNIGSVTDFCPPIPPVLGTKIAIDAYAEVFALGRADSTCRTADQTAAAKFWAGLSGSVTVVGVWNRICASLVVSHIPCDDLINANLAFKLVNFVSLDAEVAVWAAKYKYNTWRPVTAFRADFALNADFHDLSWLPLLPSPACPEYVSEHAAVAAAVSASLEFLFGANVAVRVCSSELLDINALVDVDINADVNVRAFASISAAALECARSGVFAGTHFSFSVTAGQNLGLRIAASLVAQVQRLNLLRRSQFSSLLPNLPVDLPLL
jgi:hypothetical protein